MIDSQEALDGTNPLDRGSYATHLSSPIYTLWNRALNMLNIVELVNPTGDDSRVSLSLYGINGDVLYSLSRTVPAQNEVDIILNDLPGFKTSPFGLVKIEFDTSIDRCRSLCRGSVNGGCCGGPHHLVERWLPRSILSLIAGR